MAKTIKELEVEKRLLEMSLKGFESELLSINDRTSDDAIIIRGQIGSIRDNIDIISKQLDMQELKEEKADRRANWKKDKSLVDHAINRNKIGYLTTEDKFIYCKDYGVTQTNTQFKTFPATRIIRVMSKLIGQVIKSKDNFELIDYFQESGHSYLEVTSSFNKGKWNEQEVYNKMSVIRDSWLVPDWINSQDYDREIDVLISCIAGGKQENIDHLEQWVAFKFLKPHKNAHTPNLDLGGNPGGNGKGTMITMLKTIFTNTCVIQAHKEELEKFNSNWEMAAVLYYDEPAEKELAAGKLKQATGAEDMRIEKKGIDATMADRNYNFVFMSNNEYGVVKLSGGSSGGEDRRYSVINTNLVLLDVYMDCGLTKTEADASLERIQRLVKDPVQVSRWLAHIIKKHNVESIDTLSALHGDDYQARFQDQKDEMTEAFDAIRPVFESKGSIPLTVLSEFVIAHTGLLKTLERTVGKNWAQYLTRNKIDFDCNDRGRWKTMWNGIDLRSGQGKVYSIKGMIANDFEWKDVTRTKPNYNSIGVPLAKEDLLVV